jgi:hypothetical protein
VIEGEGMNAAAKENTSEIRIRVCLQACRSQRINGARLQALNFNLGVLAGAVS